MIAIFVAWFLFAQPPTIDAFQVRFYAPGALQPLQASDLFYYTEIVCDQASPDALVTINPVRLVWDDPYVDGHVCVYIISSGGSLFSLPVGSYEGTLSAINTAGSSVESNRAGFSRAGIISAPLGVRIVR